MIKKKLRMRVSFLFTKLHCSLWLPYILTRVQSKSMSLVFCMKATVGIRKQRSYCLLYIRYDTFKFFNVGFSQLAMEAFVMDI